MTKNEQLYEEALDAIRRLYSDTDVDVEAAARNLKGLRDEIDIMLEGLQMDLPF